MQRRSGSCRRRFPRPCRGALTLPVGRRVLPVDRPDRIARDDPHLRIPLLQVAPGAAHRAAGSRRADEVRDLSLGLRPQLRPGRAIVGLGIDRVVVLVGEDGVWQGGGDGTPLHDVVVRMIRRDRRRCDDHLRAQRSQQPGLLLGHLVRHREDAAVAFDRGRERQADAGVPRCCLHDHAAGLEPAITLGGLDHRESDAVLHRAAGIEELRLRVHRRADALRHPLQADERRPADGLEDIGVRLKVLGHSNPAGPWRCRAGPAVCCLAFGRSCPAAHERCPARPWAGPAPNRDERAACRRVRPR